MLWAQLLGLCSWSAGEPERIKLAYVENWDQSDAALGIELFGGKRLH